MQNTNILMCKYMLRIDTEQREISQEKRNKRHSNKDEKVKPSLFIEVMILHLENLRECINTPLELINRFSKVSGYTTTHKLICSSKH